MRGLITALAFCCAVAASGQIYIDSYRFASAQLLLDEYPGAAAAYSLRKLDADYTGNVIMVRRTSDSDSLDIGFSGDYLDTAALKTFCSSTSCFIRRWYDQSGNGRDMEQLTVSSQPQIISNGNLFYLNSKPSVYFLTSSFLERADFTTFSNTLGQAVIAVSRSDTSLSNMPLVIKYAASGGQRQWALSNDNYNVQEVITSYNANNQANGVNTQTQQLNFGNWIPATSTILYQNSTNSYTATTPANDISASTVAVRLGRSIDGTIFRGYMQEAIIYSFSQASNRSGIETNINNFYNIY